MEDIQSVIINEFSKEQRIVASNEFICGLGIDDDCKKFLKEIGCPIFEELAVNFNLINQQPMRLKDFQLIEKQRQYGQFVCLGTNENDCPFCLNEQDGSIWSVSLNSEDCYYVNKNIIIFSGFISLYSRFCKLSKNPFLEKKFSGSDYKIDDLVQLEVTLKQLDESAFNRNITSWWPTIIDEMKLGIM